MPQPRIASVTINWNGIKVLPAALASVRNQEGLDVSLILVDNASTDGSCEWAGECGLDVQVIRHEQNLGFATGCNTGIQKALEQQADFVLLLNNDVVLERDALRLLLGETLADKDIGVIGPSVWRKDDPSLLDSAYGRICFNHVVVKRLGVSRRAGPLYLTPCDVDCVFGSVLLVRAEVFRDVGLFDEALWMFLEEVDFCYRVRQLGWRVRYFPPAKAYHWSGYSISSANAQLAKTYLLRRNSVLFLKKHGTPRRWGKFLLWVVASVAGQFAVALVRNRWAPWRARWNGYRDGFRGLPVPTDILQRYQQ